MKPETFYETSANELIKRTNIHFGKQVHDNPRWFHQLADGADRFFCSFLEVGGGACINELKCDITVHQNTLITYSIMEKFQLLLEVQ